MKHHRYIVQVKATLAIALIHFVSSYGIVPSLSRLCKPDAFGATADGYSLDTNAVLQAIIACKKGGTVLFGAGKTYLLGEITVTGRGIQLDVPPSTTLLASAEVGRIVSAASVCAQRFTGRFISTFTIKKNTTLKNGADPVPTGALMFKPLCDQLVSRTRRVERSYYIALILFLQSYSSSWCRWAL
ncbi:hypothetical protein Vretimale_305 [Volvox reticuliferus]|uniref:Uncharacterized protein n=1 Tax=Volvox reticuliferus TaxID=1737510 RepID=A0A8J4D213_9CHLO|nr:hypothetical protein Vretifemale_2591 [Volvox reticuliferus]GIL94138.1 hypothetical protein Vretimale_305 [Volvox reticuliferus]